MEQAKLIAVNRCLQDAVQQAVDIGGMSAPAIEGFLRTGEYSSSFSATKLDIRFVCSETVRLRLPHLGVTAEDQVGDRIGDNPRATRSDPLHNEQFALSAHPRDGPNGLSPI